MAEITQHSDEDWRRQLTPEQYAVCRCSATEPPFRNKYWNTKTEGTYACVCCGQELFSSAAKFDSGTGWPSYWQPIAPGRVSEHMDESHGMIRTEVRCSACGSHLGHLFDDGPAPTGLRYCINSASLLLKAADEAGKSA